MRFLSLFSGIGGLDLGLERAGMACVGQVELDPFCVAVLERHWPEVPRHDDVRTTAQWWLQEPRPPVDLVAGGFPCQPVSSAGRRRAQEDDRWLWPAMADVIGALRPRHALMENVRGLLNRGMGDILGDLAALGYDAEWDLVRASDVGAPHRRERVFILATDTRLADPARRRAGRARLRAVAAGPASARSGLPQLAHPTGDRENRPRAVDDPAGSGLSDGVGQPGSGPPPDGPAQPWLGGDADGVPAWLDGHRWPAPPGPQHPWEPPRTVDPVRGDGRARRVKALGNAVVPQVAELVGRAVMARYGEQAPGLAA